MLPGTVSSTETRTLAVERSPLVASISAGAAIIASWRNPVILDASRSMDPDFCKPGIPGELQMPCEDPGLRFVWTCMVPSTGSVCRRVADDRILTLGDGSRVAVDVPMMSRGEFNKTDVVRVSVAVIKGSRSAHASITINLTEEPVMQTAIRVLKASPHRVLLRATPAEPSTCKWAIVGGNIPRDISYKSAPYSDAEFISTGWESLTLSVLPRAPVAATVIFPGNTYTIRLTCTTPTGLRGVASYTLRIGVPPWGGTCNVSPASVHAFQPVTVTCITWSAEELPMQYAFGTGLRQVPGEGETGIPGGGEPGPEISYSVWRPPRIERTERIDLVVQAIQLL